MGKGRPYIQCDPCPHKQRRHRHREGCRVTTKAETRVPQLQAGDAGDCWPPRKLESRQAIVSRTCRERVAGQHLDSGPLASRTAREQIAAVLSHPAVVLRQGSPSKRTRGLSAGSVAPVALQRGNQTVPLPASSMAPCGPGIHAPS